MSGTIKAIDWRFRPPFGSFLGGPVWPKDTMVTMDDCIKEMDAVGVEIGVVPFRKGMDNRDIAGLMQAYPDRFRVLCHLDPWDGAKALEDIDRYVGDGQAAGVIIEPGQIHIQKPMKPDDAMLYPIYEKCQRDGVLVTITFGGMMCAGLEYYDPVALDHVAKDFPDLTLVISHGGWPHALELCHIAWAHKNVYISPDCYMVADVPGSEIYVKAANSQRLQDQIIFGSVYPASLQLAYDAYVTQLTPEALPKVLYQNAAKLLGMGDR